MAMADDMGWGDPSCYSEDVTLPDGSPHPDQGWIQTPVMDEMAANGLRFTRFYAASAVCSPTRASCLTGRNPFRVGIPFANDGRLGFDETPLSSILAEAGYRCGHFGKWHLGSLTTLRADSNRGGDASVYSAPWHHGYHTCFVTESKVPTYHPYRVTNNSSPLPTSFADPNFYGTYYWRMPEDWNFTSGEGSIVPVDEVNNASDGDDSKLIVEQALPFIRDAAANDDPFFLVLWFHTPHKPLVDPDGLTSTDSSDALHDSIVDMDAALGLLRNELIDLGIREDTMFWLTSDNGPENGDDSPNEISTARSIRSGRFRQRKRSLYEGGLRVPSILEWPAAIPAARVTSFPAVTSDYYPTILDYLQLTVADQKPLDGISLRPLIEGSASTRSQPIGFKINAHRSWTAQRYKIIDAGGGWELYDLLNVPEGEEVEQNPLATADNIRDQSEATQAIYQEMLDGFNTWEHSLSGDSPHASPARPSVSLSAPGADLGDFVEISVEFDEPVTQLHGHEFQLTGASLIHFVGQGTSYTLTVLACESEQVIITLPEGAAIDSDGNPNLAPPPLVLGEAPPTESRPISVAIDIGHSTQLTEGPWNNFSANTSGSPLDIDDLATVDGQSSGISLRYAKSGTANIGGTGANYDGPYPDELGDLPSSALRDGFFIQDGSSITLTLAGLESNYPVDLVLYGARGNNGSPLQVTIVGETSVSLSLDPIHLNETTVLTPSGIIPSPAGEIRLILESEGPSSAALNYLGLETSITVETSPDDAPILPHQDCDGDGSTNLAEYIAGTDPKDRSSFFQVTIDGVADDSATLAWMSLLGRDYTVQWSEDALAWTDLSTVTGSAGEQAFEIDRTSLQELTNGPTDVANLLFRVQATLSTNE